MRSRWLGLVRDAAAPIALAVTTVVDVAVSSDTFGHPRWLVFALLLPMSLLLALRRHWPALVVVGVAALSVAYIAAVQDRLAEQPPIEPFLGLLLALFTLAAIAPMRRVIAALVLAGAMLVGEEAAALGAGRKPGDVFPAFVVWGATVAVGRLVFHRRAEATAAETRAARAEVERDERARLAVALERTRIARELHDVVAHNLSVIVIQASAEARSDDTAGSRETWRMVERTGRETLAELRNVLGLLRTDGDVPALMSPPPSLRQLDALVAQLRGAGLVVDVQVTGEDTELPAGIDLSAFRIAQEALTNVLKHAPGARVLLRLTYGADAVVVEVSDDGAATGMPVPRVGGSGHGMVGMRERVALYGGTLEAGPTGRRGFRVRAELPLARESA